MPWSTNIGVGIDFMQITLTGAKCVTNYFPDRHTDTTTRINMRPNVPQNLNVTNGLADMLWAFLCVVSPLEFDFLS